MFNRDFIISFNDAEQNNKMHIENWRVVSKIKVVLKDSMKLFESIKQIFYSKLPWILLMEDFFERSAVGSSVSLILIPGQINLSRICHELTVVTRDTCHIPSRDQRCVTQSPGSKMAIDK